MGLKIIRQFVWIQYVRIALALALVGSMLVAGIMARSPWLIVLAAPLFTILYALGKWAAFSKALRTGGIRKALTSLAITLPIQAFLVGILYFIGLGVGKLFGSPMIVDLSAIDVGLSLALFAFCAAASVAITAGEYHLKIRSSEEIERRKSHPTADGIDVPTLGVVADDSAALINKVEGRIFFPGNPWPLGHRVQSCTFNASIDPNVGAYTADYPNPGPALLLEFELITANYNEGDPADANAEGDSDWTSKIVWNNYGNARIGPSQSSKISGIRVSDGRTPFVFDLPEYRFLVDTLPINWESFHETAGFGIYLLGHDAVANHDIHLHSRQPDGSYTLDWTGKIALIYSGEDEFKHEFKARVTGVRFDSLSLFYFDVARAKDFYGIELDPNLSARDYIAPFVSDPECFVFHSKIDGLDRVSVSATRGAPSFEGKAP